MAKIGRQIKYMVRLTPEERAQLEGIIRCGQGAANRLLKARILLKADVSDTDLVGRMSRFPRPWRPVPRRFLRTRRQLAEEGLESALSRKKKSGSPPRTFDRKAEAKLIALACCGCDRLDPQHDGTGPYPNPSDGDVCYHNPLAQSDAGACR